MSDSLYNILLSMLQVKKLFRANVFLPTDQFNMRTEDSKQDVFFHNFFSFRKPLNIDLFHV